MTKNKKISIIEKIRSVVELISLRSLHLSYHSLSKKIFLDYHLNSYKSDTGKRIRTSTKHKTFWLTKKQLIKRKKLPKISKLVKESNLLFWNNRWVFFRLALVFTVMEFVLVKGLGSSLSLINYKGQVSEILGGGNDFEVGILSFGQLLSSDIDKVGQASGVYHLLIIVLVILASLWIIRKINNGEKPKVKDAFYNGAHPIVPFLLLLFLIMLEFLPVIIGNYLINTVFSNGLAVTSFEKAVWIVFYIGLAMISLYMVLSSIFALIIVTLNDVIPVVALRSARNLVLNRRLMILSRFIVLLLIIGICISLIFLPLIIYLTIVVEPLFVFVSCIALIYSVIYIYNLYKQLL